MKNRLPIRMVPVLLSISLLSACDKAGTDFAGSSPGPGSEGVSHSGLVFRPDNMQCLATNFRRPSAAVHLERIVTEQDFAQPVGIFPLPNSDNVFYVPQQNGVIWRVERGPDESFHVNEFVDLRDYYNVFYHPGSCYECGLYSMAFHPNFMANGYIYLSFTEDGNNNTVVKTYIARFRSDDGGMTLAADDLVTDALSRETIYHVMQPTGIHNNGHIAFGPDGYLYAGLGDGGPSGDENNNAQNINNPFGAILRLTETGEPAPGNNVPGGLPEIYAYGLRNPWRWSFDRVTGELWVGDVGQSRNEEVNLIVNGGNYGWSCLEGLGLFKECGNAGMFISPILDYSHTEGVSITGGYVYRGDEIPGLQGVYIFGDFVTGQVWGLVSLGGSYQRVRLIASGKMISAFGEDNNGELYLVDYAGGGIYRIKDATGDTELPPLPARLSATGCVNASDPTQPSDGLIPYDITESFWSDNAEKERFIALPNDGKISVQSDGDFEFPVGTVLVKNFRLHGKLIETRLLLNQPEIGWNGYSYQWNEAQTEAALLEGGLSVSIGDQLWNYPGSAECSRCHTVAAGGSLGLEARQLNRIFTYPSTGLAANQLDTFEAIGMFTSPLDANVRALAMPDSRDTDQTLATRARSYLHSNCSYCHRRGSISQSTMDLRFDTPQEFMNLCNAQPLQTDLNIDDARLLAAGDPLRSIIWHRLAAHTEHRMPPLGSNLVDSGGAELIWEWIRSLSTCDTAVGPVDAAYNVVNRLTDDYIHTQGGVLLAGPIESDWPNARWTVEVAEENPFFRIRSVANSDHYLHVENPILQAGPIVADWLSAQWILIPVDDFFVIRNRWRSDHYVYMEEGGLRSGVVAPDSLNAQWRFEQVE